MIKLLTREQLLNSQGIGASEVAAVLHLDPWRSAFQLWQQKTGRAPKPPKAPAMEYGIEMEPEAFAFYKGLNAASAQMQPQVAAEHPTLPFLRAIADGWDGKRGVEIKCPTSPKLLNSVSNGEIPVHYLLQLAACMDSFGVGVWEFLVYHSPEAYILRTVSMGNPWPLFSCINEYWNKVCLPALVDFNRRIEQDRWLGPDCTPTVNEIEWGLAIASRNRSTEMIERFEQQKSEADARLKQMVGSATRATCGGWRAGWTRRKPTYELSVKVTSEEKLAQLREALKSIEGADGISEVKSISKPENYVFNLQAEREE